jgi:hypothetical protein
MIIICKKERKEWEAEMEVIKSQNDNHEFHLTNQGRKYHVLVGKHSNANYLCIPTFGISCELSDLRDTFWNAESIGYHLNASDSEALSQALKTLKLETQ